MGYFSRREIMRIGGISLAGLSLSDLFEQAVVAAGRREESGADGAGEDREGGCRIDP